MAKEEQVQGVDFLADINVKLRDIEEKQNIIRDRILLIGENLITEKEENNKEIAELRGKMIDIEEELANSKLALDRILEDRNNFARKTEFDILKRQFQMFQPMELARISDVEDIVRKIIKKKDN